MNRFVLKISSTNTTTCMFSLEGAKANDDYLIVYIPMHEEALAQYEGGEWILLSAPELNLDRWHPFTCIKVEKGIILHIKVMRSPTRLKGWTKQLQTEFLGFQFDQRRQTRWNSVAAWVLQAYDERPDLLVEAQQMTNLIHGAKVPLMVSGPYFSSLASDDIRNAEYWIMVALGVGFTGCGTLFTKVKRDRVSVFHRAKGIYQTYVKDFCKKQNIRLEANPKERREFWGSIENKIKSQANKFGTAKVVVTYCGNTMGMKTLQSLIKQLAEENKTYKKLRLYAEGFG